MFFLRNNTLVKKVILVDKKAKKEFERLSTALKAKIDIRVTILARDGKLAKPYGKKIDHQLFEIRVKVRNQWRVLYAYVLDDYVVLLSAFQKKIPQTPRKEINKAHKRLERYL